MYFFVELNTLKALIPHVINKWNNLDLNIRSSSNYHIFLNLLLKFIRVVERKIFTINGPSGMKMLIRLRLGFSHLRQHKFKHGFKETLDPFCFCSIEAELTIHYFLRYHFYNSYQEILKNVLENIPISFLTVSDNIPTTLLLYENDKFDDTKNRKILMPTIRFIKDSLVGRANF